MTKSDAYYRDDRLAANRWLLLVSACLFCLACAFVAGIVLNDPLAWLLAGISIALFYCATIAQVTWPPARLYVIGFTTASIIIGAFSGLALVFH